MHIVKPIITEKTLKLATELNYYTFVVSPKSNKTEAAKELAAQFGVKVEAVKVHNRLGQQKFWGTGNKRRPGRTQDQKIMLFKLEKGSKIALFQA